MLEGRFTLRLECDNDKTHKDVDHEECDDDDVDEVENGDVGAIVVQRSDILSIRVNGNIQDSIKRMKVLLVKRV